MIWSFVCSSRFIHPMIAPAHRCFLGNSFDHQVLLCMGYGIRASQGLSDSAALQLCCHSCSAWLWQWRRFWLGSMSEAAAAVGCVRYCRLSETMLHHTTCSTCQDGMSMTTLLHALTRCIAHSFAFLLLCVCIIGVAAFFVSVCVMFDPRLSTFVSVYPLRVVREFLPSGSSLLFEMIKFAAPALSSFSLCSAATEHS